MTLFDLVLLFFSHNITRMPLYTRTIILCNTFIAISQASLVLYFIVSRKCKSIEHNIIEIAQNSLQVFYSPYREVFQIERKIYIKIKYVGTFCEPIILRFGIFARTGTAVRELHETGG
jgi:hypothetical protein